MQEEDIEATNGDPKFYKKIHFITVEDESSAEIDEAPGEIAIAAVEDESREDDPNVTVDSDYLSSHQEGNESEDLERPNIYGKLKWKTNHM